MFRSLMDKNPKIIKDKKTFGATEEIRIEIDFNWSQSTFTHNNWENINRINDIYIFDSVFIHENIYQWEIVNEKTQEKLNNLILWETGRNLQKLIDSDTIEINRIATEKKRITSDITTVFGRTFNVSRLLEIKKTIANYTSAKKEKQDTIAQYTKKNVIQKDLNLLVQSLELDKTSINLSINQTVIVDISAMKSHFENINPIKIANVLPFMESGLTFLKDTKPRNCSFCGQLLTQKEENLFAIFAQYFNWNYRTVRDSVKKVKAILISKSYSQIIKIVTKIDSDHWLWLSKFFDKTNLSDLYNKVIVEVDEKIKDLSYIVIQSNLDEYYSQLELIIVEIKKIHDLYNDPQGNILKKNQDDLSLITLEEKRFSEEWVKKITDYDKLESETIKSARRRDENIKLLKTYCATITEKYNESLNIRLEQLNADFRLQTITPRTAIRGTSDMFEIKVNETIIKINGDEYNFSNSLSESDKRILAFAFFLCLLDENSLDSSIVIFDDPINSLDHERKRFTSEIIGRLAKPEQIIVLTHDREFLRDMSTDPWFLWYKLLEITRWTNESATLNDSTKIAEIVNDEVRKLTKCVYDWHKTWRIPRDYEKNCRTLLELVFELKHHDLLKGVPHWSIGTYTKLVFWELNGPYRETILEFERVSSYLHPPLHDGTYPEVTDGDKIAALAQSIKCLKLI